VPLPDNESPSTYASVGEEFVRVLLRYPQGHSSGFEMPLTPVQHQFCIALFEALLGDGSAISDTLHRLLWELITARVGTVDSTIMTCLFQSWFAVHALKDDGTFIDADAFAPFLAKVKYLLKTISIIKAQRRQSTHPNGIIGYVFSMFYYPSASHFLPASAVIDVHEEALALGLNAPYNIVYEIQQFTSSLSHKQLRPPKLFWSDAMDRVTISGETLVLGALQGRHRVLLASELVRGTPPACLFIPAQVGE